MLQLVAFLLGFTALQSDFYESAVWFAGCRFSWCSNCTQVAPIGDEMAQCFLDERLLLEASLS